jgi:hypothetical protein
MPTIVDVFMDLLLYKGGAGEQKQVSCRGGVAGILHRSRPPEARPVADPRCSAIAAGLAIAMLGCAAHPAPGPPPAKGRSGHGWALLHELLGNEKDVAKLLVIKQAPKPLEQTIDAISDLAREAYARLDELADAAPAVDLTDTGLPADERRARDAIAAMRRDQLLAASGRDLEIEMLLSQNEALVYAIGLTDTLSRSESNGERLAFVRALHEDVTRLQREVLGLLRKR